MHKYEYELLRHMAARVWSAIPTMSVDTMPPFKAAVRDACDFADFRRDSWGIYDSPISSYDHAFRSVLGRDSLAERVAQRAAETGKTPFVIDFMASTAALRSLSRSLQHRHGGIAMEGVATGLTDQRHGEDRVEDKRNGIVHVPGNILRSDTRRLLRKAIGGRPADLIVERAVAGLACLPFHQKFYGYALDTLWSALAPDGGQMFVQVDEGHLLCADMPPSREIVRTLQAAGIEAASGPSPESDDYAVMYVRRTSDVDIERPSELLR